MGVSHWGLDSLFLAFIARAWHLASDKSFGNSDAVVGVSHSILLILVHWGGSVSLGLLELLLRGEVFFFGLGWSQRSVDGIGGD